MIMKCKTKGDRLGHTWVLTFVTLCFSLQSKAEGREDMDELEV